VQIERQRNGWGSDGMTIVSSYDPISKKYTHKVVQFVKDESTGKWVEQKAWDVPKNQPVNIQGKGAIVVASANSLASQVKQTMPTTSWEDTSASIKDKQKYYEYLLGQTDGTENAVVVKDNKMYIAPYNQESLARGARVADLTKSTEVEYDPYLAEAFRLRRQYGNDWTQVINMTQAEKSNVDNYISDAHKRYYQEVVRPQRQAQLQYMIESGMKDPVYNKEGKMIGTKDNPEYFQAKSAYEMAQRGLVSVNIGGVPHVMTPQQISEINANVGKIQAVQAYNQQVDTYNASIPQGAIAMRQPKMVVPDGSIYQELGVTQKPLSKIIQQLPTNQRQQVEMQLQRAYVDLGRPESCYTIFRNKYLANPNQYLQNVLQKNVDAYDGLTKQFEEKMRVYNEAYEKYVQNPTPATLLRFQKAEVDAKAQAETLDYFKNSVLQPHAEILSSLTYGRSQTYKSRRKRPPVSTRKKSKPPVKITQKKKIKGKPTKRRIQSFTDRFARASRRFMGV